MLPIRRILAQLLIVYVCLHVIYSIHRHFYVDTRRVSYKKIINGPLLLKPGRVIKNEKNQKVVQAVGFGIPSALSKNARRSSTLTKVVQKEEEPIALTDHMKKEVINAAQTITNNSSFIYVTMINSGYRRMTLNWLCNTILFNNVHDRTLIIDVDGSTCQSIHRLWDDTVECVNLGISRLSKDYVWGKLEYRQLLNLRAELMLTLVSENIPFVLFETDAVWFRDPFDLFEQRLDNYEDLDVIVPVKGYPNGKTDVLSFDPMLVNPTNASRQLFSEMLDRLSNDSSLYDQDLLNEFCSEQMHGLVCRRFDYSEVSDGKWFKQELIKQNVPFIANNNFNSGVSNKETRQSMNGFWFLMKNDQCRLGKVRKFVYNFS